ncbi:MAG TPA: hypothetical protein VN088_09110 [Nocardioides sp.]|nr:hypothetical protein [Nocardioides sp.]
MTTPPLPPPEPLMPLMIAAKPGARPREVHIDEATCERLMAELAASLEAIRAAKRAYADWAAPRGADPLPPEGTAVDATIHEEWCVGGHDDSAPCDSLPRSLGGKRCPAVRMTVTGPVQCEIFAGHAGRHADDDLMDWGELAPSCPDSHPLDGMACERSDGHDGPHRYMPFAPAGGQVVVEWTAADVLAHSIATGQPVIVEDDEPQACGGELPAPVTGADVLLAAAALDIEMREAASGMQDPAPVVRVTGGELPAPAAATETEAAL